MFRIKSNPARRRGIGEGFSRPIPVFDRRLRRVDHSDRDDDSKPPAPKYLNDEDNFPIVPIDGRDHGHDHDNR